MRYPFLVAVSSLTFAGCAGMDAGECRGANWYDLGFRDAIFGIQRQDDLYTAQCDRHGVRVDRPRYAEGWRDGDYEAQRRRNQSGVE